jgi:hypothetical protein
MVDLGPTKDYTPRAGDIGITVISGWGGKAVRAAQFAAGCGFADFEHAYVVESVHEDTGNVWIVEAMPGGAQRVLNWHTVNRFLICPDEHREAVAAAAREQAVRKVPYSGLDYGAIALHRFHVPVPHLQHYIESSGHQICSQLADYCADKGGWHLFADGRWPGFVRPCDLYRAFNYQQMGGTWPLPDGHKGVI